MSAPAVIIESIRRESTMQRTLSEDDDVIQALTATGPNEPFHVGPLPGRSALSLSTSILRRDISDQG